ncbi:transposase [Streptomyces bluensis]|uniref:transposase n=1 Tax=Streptomyces bluensis TaxID=33897 RepID=UPI0019ACC449|nr:hypothetical protein GCM10010344_01780 [Streptomyces bluensis]
MDASGHVLAVTITSGQRGDAPQFNRFMARIRVARIDSGRPRTRPSRVIADRAYSSRAIRSYLRRRRIAHTIPEKQRDAVAEVGGQERCERGAHFEAQDCGEELGRTMPVRGLYGGVVPVDAALLLMLYVRHMRCLRCRRGQGAVHGARLSIRLQPATASRADPPELSTADARHPTRLRATTPLPTGIKDSH